MTDQSQQATRRGVLLGGCVLGVGGVLTACSTATVPYDANDAGQVPGAAPASAAPASMAPAATPSNTASAKHASAAKGTALGQAAAIPVGGGVIYTAAKVVVTQPAKGEFKAFSAVCTHVGCLCNQVADGTINCPCHGSKFKITDGSVVTGPAPSPLAAKQITVTDGTVRLL